MFLVVQSYYLAGLQIPASSNFASNQVPYKLGSDTSVYTTTETPQSVSQQISPVPFSVLPRRLFGHPYGCNPERRHHSLTTFAAYVLSHKSNRRTQWPEESGSSEACVLLHRQCKHNYIGDLVSAVVDRSSLL